MLLVSLVGLTLFAGYFGGSSDLALAAGSRAAATSEAKECGAASKLSEAGQAEEARAVLKQSLTAALVSPAAEVRPCIIEEIVKFALTAAKASTSHCEAGKWLLKQHDPDAAKSEYEAAIKEDANRQCGIEGLEKARSKITADKRISIDDVGNSVLDELLNVAWPWLVAALLIRGTLAFARGYIWTPNRTSLTAPRNFAHPTRLKPLLS